MTWWEKLFGGAAPDDAPSAFAVGELVRLKSGGPVMTVKRDVGYAEASATYLAIGVHCSWIDAYGNSHLECFYDPQLERITDERQTQARE